MCGILERGKSKGNVIAATFASNCQCYRSDLIQLSLTCRIFGLRLFQTFLAPLALLSVLSIFWFGANGTFVRSARFFFGISKTLLLSIGFLCFCALSSWFSVENFREGRTRGG